MKLDIKSFNSNMVKSLPSFYLAEDIKHDNVLRRYLGSVFIGGADDILKSINHTIDLIDPYKCPTEDLPELFKSWGLRYEPTLDESYQRKLLANIGEVYRRKGSYSCVRYLVRSITGRDCDVIYTRTESGERRLDVTLISKSLNDIVSGEIQEATQAIQKIIPQFLPFYLVPNVSFSSPRGSLEFETRNLGFRASERVFSDFTFKGLDNLFLNPDFSLGTDLWEVSENHSLTVTDVKKDSNNCLKSVWTKDSYFYQDIDVHYKDVYSTKAYFMCPTEYLNNPPKITMLLTYYRANDTIACSVFKTEVELNIKNRWCYLKRNFYVDDPLCVRVRIAYYCSTPNQDIYFSNPQLLRKSRVEQLQCADILNVIPNSSGCSIEWSPVMGATEYLIYSADTKGALEYLGAQSVSNRYIWGNAPLAEEGLKLLVVSTNGHITSDPEPEKCALYYSRCTATGNPIQINDSLEYPLQGLSLYGKSTQDGTPTPENPVDIVSVGDSGFDIISKNDTHFNLLSVRDNGGEIITKQPVSAVGKNGETKQFIVSASGSGITYQWWQNVNNGKGWVIMDTAGARQPIFNIPVAAFRNGYKFRCVVTDSNGNSETSNEVTLYVVSDECEINTASITSALPLCGIPVSEGGNYTDKDGQQWICDELIYNADGTGKIIKRTAVYTIAEDTIVGFMANAGSYQRAAVNLAYSNIIAPKDGTAMCTAYRYDTGFRFAVTTASIDDYAGCFAIVNGGTTNINIRFVTNATTSEQFISENLGVKIIYQRETPQEIDLSAAEMAELKRLQTCEGSTNAFNSGDTEMTIKYCGTQDFNLGGVTLG